MLEHLVHLVLSLADPPGAGPCNCTDGGPAWLQWAQGLAPGEEAFLVMSPPLLWSET